MSVQDAVLSMGAYVDQGRFAEAAAIGNTAAVPLGVSSAAVSVGDPISHGTQSTVYRAVYSSQDVALKKAKISKASDLDNFKLEIIIMAKLRNASNVVGLLAARLIPPGYMLIMPYVPHNLSAKLHHDGWRPDWTAVLQFAISLTTAVAAVHAAGILHRDIKPGNILLDDVNTPYICDFGIAIPTTVLEEDDAGGSKQGKPSGGFHKRNMIGTLEYMAPETLQKRPPSDKSDIWALAVTLNEVATGVFPYSDCTHENPAAHTVLEMGYGRQELAAGIATEGLLPLMSPGTPQPLAALLTACWQLDPAERPSAAKMLKSLQSMQANELRPGHHGAWQQAGCAQTPHSGHRPGMEGQNQAHSADRPSPGLLAPGSVTRMAQAEGQEADSTYRPQVTAGAFATAGLRGADRMEDSHIIQHHLNGVEDMHLLAVFDGHRGAQTAQFAAQNIAPVLAERLQSQHATEALSSSFISLDNSFRKQEEEQWKARVQRMGPAAAGKQTFPGCTALAVLLAGSQLYAANAGDCRAVLCRSGQAVALSEDQTADVASERERVQAAGASIQWKLDSWRVGDAGIQVTRSLGDADLKPALTAQPAVTQRQLSSKDEFVILASDGLWDKLHIQEAVGLVLDTVKQPAMAAQRLATEALTRGSGDNITVVVAFLKPVDTLESIFKGGRQKHAATATFYSSRRSKHAVNQKPSADEVAETL